MGSEETTLCGIGDAVQPFAATFPQPLAQGAVLRPGSRGSLQSPFRRRPKGGRTRRKRQRLARL
jgi:hypothetical protein